MGIVNASRKLGYKIAMWSMLVIGIGFLALSGIFILSGGMESTKPNKLFLTDNGIYMDSDGEYNMDVWQKETSVMASTSPKGSSERITFAIVDGDDCLQISDSKGKDINGKGFIWPGASAKLTLSGGSNTSYKFGRTVKIDVKSHLESRRLNVKICLPPDQVGFSYRLYNFTNNFDLLNYAISAPSYESYVKYGPDEKPTSALSPFVFEPKIIIFGTEIQADKFSAVWIDAGSAEIASFYQMRLFGIEKGDPDVSGGFGNMYIPQYILNQVKSGSKPEVFTFLVTATAQYEGVDYPFIDYFNLTIVP